MAKRKYLTLLGGLTWANRASGHNNSLKRPEYCFLIFFSILQGYSGLERLEGPIILTYRISTDLISNQIIRDISDDFTRSIPDWWESDWIDKHVSLGEFTYTAMNTLILKRVYSIGIFPFHEWVDIDRGDSCHLFQDVFTVDSFKRN